MVIGEKLAKEFDLIISGDAWYGSPVLAILEQVEDSSIHQKMPNIHTIAELLLHLIAWNEEVTQRLLGKPARLPSRGDWPDASLMTKVQLIGLFKFSNEQFKEAIKNVAESDWNALIIDKREPAVGNGVTNEALVRGLIQHTVYHAGQIAMLTKHLHHNKY